MNQKTKTLLYLLFLLFACFPIGNASAAVTAKLPNNLGLVGYWNLNEGAGTNAGDMSGKGNSGSFVGTPTWVTGKMGKALNFGSGTAVSIPRNSAFEPASAVTVSAWVYWNDYTTTNYGRVINKHNTTDTNPWMSYEISQSGTGNNMYFSINVGGVNRNAGGGTVSTKKWHNIVGSWSSGATVKFYLDGVLLSQSGAAYSGAITYYNTPLMIGWAGYGSPPANQSFNGIIDEARVYSRELSAVEIEQLYQASSVKFFGPSNTGLVGYWPLEEGAGTNTGDMSGNGNTGTITGTSWTTGKRGGALDFNSMSSVVTVGTSDNFLQTGASQTVSAWIYPRTLGESSSGRIFNRNGGTANVRLAMDVNNALIFQVYGGATSLTTRTVDNTIVLNKWQYVTMTWDGSAQSGKVHLYINGVEASYSMLIDGASLVSPTGAITSIGARTDNTRYFDGLIDEVRAYNRVLSATEVATLYQNSVKKVVYNSSQNSRITNGLVGFWSMNGADVSGTTVYDRSGNGNNGTMGGTTNPALSTGRVGQGITTIPAQNQYITVPNSASLQVTPQVSVSHWFYPTAAGNAGGNTFIVSKGNGNLTTTQSYVSFWDSSNQIQWRVGSSGGLSGLNSNPLTLNEWHHMVGTYDGTTMKLYVDGDLVATSSPGVTLQTRTEPLIISSMYTTSVAAGTSFPGKIDEVRVYDRALTASEAFDLYSYGSINKSYFWRTLAINNTTNASTLANYQVSFTLDTATPIAANKMRSDCGDIRVYDADRKTSLNYWIESGCNTASTKIWATVGSIPASISKNIYLSYGSPNKAGVSSGVNTFDFFDDFDSASLDSSKWMIWGNPNPIRYSTSLVKLNGDGSYTSGLTSQTKFSDIKGMALDFRMNTNQGSNGRWAMYGYTQQDVFGNSEGLPLLAGVIEWCDNNTWCQSYSAPSYGYSTGASYVADLFSTYSVGTRTNGQIDFTKNYGAIQSTAAGTITAANQAERVFLASHDAFGYVDWVRTRKYSYPEPTVTAGAEWLDSAN